MKKTLSIHLGIHKTGTTLLQNDVFPNIENIGYIKKPDLGVISGDKKTSLFRFMSASPLIWRNVGEALIQKIEKRARGEAGEKDLLISDEHAIEANDPLRIARHLRELERVVENSYQINILVVVRRQDTWFASAYAQMSNRYDCASQEHFEDWVEERVSYNKKFFSGCGVRLRYATLYEEISNNLKSSDITIIPFELLKSRPNEFIRKCCKFVSKKTPKMSNLKKTNKRSTSRKKWEIRPIEEYINLRPQRVFKSFFGKSRIRIPAPRRGKEVELTKRTSDKILNVYEKENKRLCRHLEGYNLEEYGYF